MDMNEYALEVFAHDRLAELRANGERANWAPAGASAARALLVTLGHVLVRLGHRRQGMREYSLPTADTPVAIDTRGASSRG